jgi:hypothetical protein
MKADHTDIHARDGEQHCKTRVASGMICAALNCPTSTFSFLVRPLADCWMRNTLGCAALLGRTPASLVWYQSPFLSCSSLPPSPVWVGRWGSRDLILRAGAHHLAANRGHRDQQPSVVLIRIRRSEGEGERPKIRPRGPFMLCQLRRLT